MAATVAAWSSSVAVAKAARACLPTRTPSELPEMKSTHETSERIRRSRRCIVNMDLVGGGKGGEGVGNALSNEGQTNGATRDRSGAAPRLGIKTYLCRWAGKRGSEER